jgi:hypothetical protein
MTFDVFISYAHQDKAAADAACAKLEAEGIRCWIAPRDVPPGTEWAAAIIDAIDHCRAMVLIFSSSANTSRQIRREAQRAFDMEVPVVPFRIENVPPEKSLAYYMGTLHWLDALTPPIEQHLQKLAASLQGFLQVTTPGHDRQEEPALRDVEARRNAEQEQRKQEGEHQRQTAAEAERERLEREAAVRLEAEERNRQTAAAEAERQRQEGAAAAMHEAQRAEPQRVRDDVEATRSAPAQVRKGRLWQPERPLWPPSRPALVAASLIGLVVLGAVGAGLVLMWPRSLHTPTTVANPPPATPGSTAPDRGERTTATKLTGSGQPTTSASAPETGKMTVTTEGAPVEVPVSAERTTSTPLMGNGQPTAAAPAPETGKRTATTQAAPLAGWNSVAASIWKVDGKMHVAIGYSGTRSTADDARSSAIQACRDAGGRTCKATGAWNSGCVYITTGNAVNKAGWGSGDSVEQALSKCREQGLTCKQPVGGCVN